MPHYRIKIKFQSPLGTPLISGTLWGHMAWAIKYLEGESGFALWLSGQNDNPWLLTSGIPLGKLPKPILKPSQARQFCDHLEDFDTLKMVKKEPWISENLFIILRNDLQAGKLEQQMFEALKEKKQVRDQTGDNRAEELPMQKIFHQARNRIDRLIASTPQEGGLYFNDAYSYGVDDDFHEQIFMFTPNDEKKRLDLIFHYLGQNGFGSKASIGRGVFKHEIEDEINLFAKTGNRCMTLSHGIKTENMLNCRYKLHTHFGRLGAEFAQGRYSPFKYPVLMIAPGATFIPDNQGPYGQLLDHVHHDPELAGIRHHAFHLPVYFTEAES